MLTKWRTNVGYGTLRDTRAAQRRSKSRYAVIGIRNVGRAVGAPTTRARMTAPGDGLPLFGGLNQLSLPVQQQSQRFMPD
jgi:hypothetical protein